PANTGRGDVDRPGRVHHDIIGGAKTAERRGRALRKDTAVASGHAEPQRSGAVEVDRRSGGEEDIVTGREAGTRYRASRRIEVDIRAIERRDAFAHADGKARSRYMEKPETVRPVARRAHIVRDDVSAGANIDIIASAEVGEIRGRA